MDKLPQEVLIRFTKEDWRATGEAANTVFNVLNGEGFRDEGSILGGYDTSFYVTVRIKGDQARNAFMNMLKKHQYYSWKLDWDVPELEEGWQLPEIGSATFTFPVMTLDARGLVLAAQCIDLINRGVSVYAEFRVFRDDGKVFEIVIRPSGEKHKKGEPGEMAMKEVLTDTPILIRNATLTQLDRDPVKAFDVVIGDIGIMTDGALDELVSTLSALHRYEGKHVRERQTVAEHTFGVEMIAMQYSDYFNGKGVRNDRNLVLGMALLHDTDEMATGDVIHDAKYRYGQLSEKLRADLTAIGAIKLGCTLSTIGNPRMQEEYLRLVRLEGERTTIEAMIVKAADNAEAMLYCRREVRLGNSAMKAIEDYAKTRLDAQIKEILATIGKEQSRLTVQAIATDMKRRGVSEQQKRHS